MPDVVWCGEPGDVRTVSAAAIEDAVVRLIPTVRDAGDVAIVLPPCPELVVSLIACERAGVVPRMVHVLDELGPLSDVELVLTSSAVVYRGELVFLKERVDDAGAGRTLVVDRTGWMPLGPTLDVYHEVPMRPDLDAWFPAIEVSSEPIAPTRMAPCLRAIVKDPTTLTEQGGPLFLHEAYLDADDETRAREAYVGASTASRGSRGDGRLS
jgi:hypothetical protein